MEKFHVLLAVRRHPPLLVKTPQTGDSLHCAAKKFFVLPMGRTRWFLSRSTGNAAAVFVFQIQHCISDRSVRFSNLTLLLPQQCCLFKSNIAFAAVVLLF